MVEAYYQGVLGQRDTLLPSSRQFTQPFAALAETPKKFRFSTRGAMLSALTSFQVGVFGFLLGYGIADFEAGFFGWLLGSSLGFLAGTLLSQ